MSVRLSLKVVAATGALALAAAMAPAAPSAAATAAAAPTPINLSLVDGYTLFTQDDHDALSQHAVHLLNAATDGSKVNITLYYFTRDEIVNALIAAHQRGVDVQIAINGSETQGKQYKALKAVRTPAPMSITTCGQAIPDGNYFQSDRGCVANRSEDNDEEVSGYSRLHAKFITLSEVALSGGGVAKNVVWIGSANFDHFGNRNAYEDTLTMRDAGLHEIYARYFGHLKEYANTTGKNDYGTKARDTKNTTADQRFTAYLSPRHEGTGAYGSATNDPVVTYLKAATAQCSATSDGDVINVANFRITRQPVVNALKAAKAKGCAVNVVTGDVDGDDGEVYPALKDLDSTVDVRVCGPATGIAYMHEKFMTVRAGTPQLYLGSQNLTFAGLRQQDEHILRVADAPIIARYDQQFQSLHNYCPQWSAASPRAPQEDLPGLD